MDCRSITINDRGLLCVDGKTICCLPNIPIRLLKSYIRSVDHKLNEEEQKLAANLATKWYIDAVDNFMSKPEPAWMDSW
jgi:hypothetical protein